MTFVTVMVDDPPVSFAMGPIANLCILQSFGKYQGLLCRSQPAVSQDSRKEKMNLTPPTLRNTIHSDTRYMAINGNGERGQHWEAQLRKGCLEMAILASLWQSRLYGLEILRAL